MVENCELLMKTKTLAKQNNLDPAKVECPFIDYCKGTKCYLMENPDTVQELQEKIAQDDKGTT